LGEVFIDFWREFWSKGGDWLERSMVEDESDVEGLDLILEDGGLGIKVNLLFIFGKGVNKWGWVRWIICELKIHMGKGKMN